MEIVWLASAIEDFVSLLEKVDSLFGKAVATKVKYKISSHINLLASFPCMGMRDFYFSDDKKHSRPVNQALFEDGHQPATDSSGNPVKNQEGLTMTKADCFLHNLKNNTINI